MFGVTSLQMNREDPKAVKRGPRGEGRQVKVFVSQRNMRPVHIDDLPEIREVVRREVLQRLGITKLDARRHIKLAWNSSLMNGKPGFNVFVKDGLAWKTYRHSGKDQRDVIMEAVIDDRPAKEVMKETVQEDEMSSA